MSIRLRLTLLYSAILALTLVALGVGIYLTVSNIALGAERDAATRELRTVAISLQPHLGPHQGGGPGPYQGGNPQPDQGQRPQSQTDQNGGIGSLIPPPDVAAQSAIQVRKPDGTVLYRSQDLQAAKLTLPLSTQQRLRLRPGDVDQTTFSEGGQRLLLVSTLLTSGGSTTGILQVAVPLRDVDQALTALWRVLLVGGGMATLLAFGAGWWLAGTAIRPIDRITQTARAIGEARDFGQRVAYEGPRDEVGRLATTFNSMLAGLEDSYQAQRRFVADASHELRTPLTSIRGNLGLLKLDPPIAEDDRVAVVDDLVSETERLSRLVGDLLTLARSDAGRPLRREPVPLQPLLAGLLRALAGSHPERTVRLEGQVQASVLGDPDAIKQVLLILLDNALKFTPPEGEVAVAVVPHKGEVAIAVRDTGAGIPAEILPQVFDRFYQADTMRAAGGSGLGLAIAKSLMERQGGTIAVESQIGRGSTFTITLPRAGTAGPPHGREASEREQGAPVSLRDHRRPGRPGAAGAAHVPARQEVAVAGCHCGGVPARGAAQLRAEQPVHLAGSPDRTVLVAKVVAVPRLHRRDGRPQHGGLRRRPSHGAGAGGLGGGYLRRGGRHFLIGDRLVFRAQPRRSPLARPARATRNVA